MKSFSNQFVVYINMCNRGNNIVFSTSIHDNKSTWWRTWRFESYFIKLLNSWFEILIFTFTKEKQSEKMSIILLSRSLTMDFILFFLFIFILFSLVPFLFFFLVLEQLRLGFISHTVTSVTNWWRSHKTDHETWIEVEGTRTKWRHTAWTTHAGLMLYSW